MGTRFYFSSVSPIVSPAFSGSWNLTSGASRYDLVTSHGIHGFFTKEVNYSTLTNWNLLAAQFVSAPLTGDQTISAPVKGIVRAAEESDDDDKAQLIIRVFDNTGTTVRGTLIPADASPLSSEFTIYPTMTNRKFPLGWTGSGQTPTTVNALDGDRIVIEVGTYRHKQQWRSVYFRFGNSVNVSDCQENETSTDDYNGWIEFGDTLSLDEPVVRMTQATGEAIYVPDARNARVTQVTGEAIVLPDSSLRNARVTQVTAEAIYEWNRPIVARITLID
jgi:hypothetical protein